MRADAVSGRRAQAGPVVHPARGLNSAAAHLPTSKVVKAFNAIKAHIVTEGRPAGADDRRALAIAGDDADAKQVVTDLINSFGFDVVDGGQLAVGERFDREKPAYGAEVGAAGLRRALAAG